MRPDEDTLRSLYIEQELSLAGIGRLYGVHKTQVRRWLLAASIPTRDISTATKLSGRFGVHSEEHREALRRGAAKSRAKITAESREKQRKKMIGRPPPNKGKKMSEGQRQLLIEQRADPEYRLRMSERHSGERNAGWKGGVKSEDARRLDRAEWRRRRLECYERDNWMCADCGRKCKNTRDSRSDGNAKIQAHHIVPRRYGGSDDLENLVTLCMSCHHKRERRYVGAFIA